MTKCPKCGYISYNDKKFCYADGTPMAEHAKLCECGHLLGGLDRFCEDCGRECKT